MTASSTSRYLGDNELWDCVKKCPIRGDTIECAPLAPKGVFCGQKAETASEILLKKNCVLNLKSIDGFQTGWNAIG